MSYAPYCSCEGKYRESEEAKRINCELLGAKKVMKNESLKLKRKITRLEERILLAGKLMFNNAPEEPNRRFTTTLNSTSRLSLIPGVMKDENKTDEAHFSLHSYLLIDEQYFLRLRKIMF